MKHIFLSHSHTRPVISSINDDVGRQPFAWSWCRSAVAESRWFTHSAVRVCSVNLRHVCAGTHPAAHFLLLLVESESQRWEQPAEVRLDRRTAPPTHLWRDAGCCGYDGEEAVARGDVATSHLPDAGLGF